MSRITTQKMRGLSLGAIVALVGSLFGVLPASAAPSTTAFTFAAAGGSSFSTLLDEDFHMVVQRDTSQVSGADMNASMKFEITTNRAYNSSTYSVGVVTGTHSGLVSAIPTAYAVSASADSNEFSFMTIHQGGNAKALNTYLPEFTAGGYSETESYVVAGSRSATANTFIGLQLLQYGAGLYPTTESGAVAVTVRAFLDLNGNNVFDASTEPSGTQVVNFVKYSSVTATAAVEALAAGDTAAVATANVSGVNLEQLSGQWSLRLNQWGAVGKIGSVSYSSTVEETFTFSAPATLKKTFTIVSATGSNTVSADLVYIKSGASVFHGDKSQEGVESFSDVIRWDGVASTTVANAGAGDISIYAVTGDNVVANATFPSAAYDVRANSTYTIRLTASGVLSASAVTATFTFSNPAVSSLKYYSVNGGAAVTSGTASATTVTVNATTGVAEITVNTVGFTTGDALSISGKIVGHNEEEIALYPVELSWTVTADATEVATAPNTATAVGVTVKDQFGVKSALTTQRVKFYWHSGYSGSATNSFVTLTAGEADALMTPSRTPSTGSAVVKAQLQNYSGTLGNWSDDSATAATVNVTVTDATNGFRTGLAASYSASISYGAAFSWSSAINAAYVVVTGSPVVVSGTGLIFKDANGDTASDSITLPGNATAQVTFQVTGRTAGSFPITVTAGSATTTSIIVVSPARSNDGASITWDTSAIAAGKTKIVTGKVVDANGNPVDTTMIGTGAGDSGTASIVVTFQGSAGIPVGSMPTETNADGEFQVSVLTSAADSGTFTLTAVYLPQGSATATDDKVTSVQAITVGDGASSDSSGDTKVNAGSFKGYVAVYAKGYEGKRLSAKIGNDWVVVESLASNFERVTDFTGAGYTIAVRIYIDRVLIDTITVTTK